MIKCYEDLKAQGLAKKITEEEYLKAKEILMDENRYDFSSIEEIYYYLSLFNQETSVKAHHHGADDSDGFYQNEGLRYIF